MKRTFFIVGLLTLVLPLLTVGCGQPEVIQIPGPQGIPGPEGDQGVQGPKGDKGDSSSLVEIYVVVYENTADLSSVYFKGQPSQHYGLPYIKQGYLVMIYGVGFVDQEHVTIYLNNDTENNSNSFFEIGSDVAGGGIFHINSIANWPEITWHPNNGRFAEIKAVGNKGSTAVALAMIGDLD